MYNIYIAGLQLRACDAEGYLRGPEKVGLNTGEKSFLTEAASGKSRFRRERIS